MENNWNHLRHIYLFKGLLTVRYLQVTMCITYINLCMPSLNIVMVML